jgi:hypothetical protein
MLYLKSQVTLYNICILGYSDKLIVHAHIISVSDLIFTLSSNGAEDERSCQAPRIELGSGHETDGNFLDERDRWKIDDSNATFYSTR